MFAWHPLDQFPADLDANACVDTARAVGLDIGEWSP